MFLQMAVGKTRMFEGVANARAGVDVIFIDCPENLPVPGISLTLKEVPNWNADLDATTLQSASTFALEHLHDDGCIIVFHSFSIASRENLAGICEAFDFKKKKDWLGMNRMHLTSPMDTTKTVYSIQIIQLLSPIFFQISFIAL